MNFFKATTKAILRSINDRRHETNLKNAQKDAYAETGKTLKAARKKGKTLNGSEEYQKRLKKKVDSLEKKHDRINNYIDDL